MKVGLTYDLKSAYAREGFSAEDTAEFDSDETVEALAGAIREYGHEVTPIGHVRDLVTALSRGERWDLVFNISEGLYGMGREAQVPAVLDAYQIPYTFSDPLVMTLTLHKGMTKRILASEGIPTAPFATIATPQDIDAVKLTYPLFVKPIAEGSSIGIAGDSKVAHPDALRAKALDLLNRHQQPVLVEEFLPGEEFTVGIVGTGTAARVLGVEQICIFPTAGVDCYSRHLKSVTGWRELMDARPAEGEKAAQCGATALAAWRALGCRDGGRIDLRFDRDGVANVIEINPLAGLAPGYSDLALIAGWAGISYQQLVGEILMSAMQRVPDQHRRR